MHSQTHSPLKTVKKTFKNLLRERKKKELTQSHLPDIFILFLFPYSLSPLSSFL